MTTVRELQDLLELSLKYKPEIADLPIFVSADPEGNYYNALDPALHIGENEGDDVVALFSGYPQYQDVAVSHIGWRVP